MAWVKIRADDLHRHPQAHPQRALLLHGGVSDVRLHLYHRCHQRHHRRGGKGKPFNRYYIGSGEPKPLREFLLEMRDLVDPAAEIGLGDLPFKGVNVSYDQFDLKKVERDTGYVNQIPFAQGIKMTADYIREEA